MNKTVLIGLLVVMVAAHGYGQDPGSFARMGFGARGMGMGNALTSVTSGGTNAYYNPALAAFSDQRNAEATFGILSLDRYLNFLGYTQAVRPNGGISAGIINSGVRNIDGRDIDGVHTDNYSTTENQIFLAFANRISPQITLGVAVKVYYSKLYDNVSTTTVGFDVGGHFLLTPGLSVGVVVKDLGSKYKWDTTPIYDTDGRQTTDQFPTLRRIGLSYVLDPLPVVLSAEYESSSSGSSLIRMGGEYALVQNFIVRGGIDRWDPSDKATGAEPSFGFTVRNSFNQLTPAFTYAYIIEPISPTGMHIITVSVSF